MMVSQDWLDRYFERHVGRRLAAWGPAVDPVLAGRIGTFLRRGLQKLNGVPSDHPFWIDTNREPTLYKLAGYFSDRLNEDPENEETIWILTSYLLLFCGDRDLGWLLQRLVKRDIANLEWVIASGLWIRANCGFHKASTLRDILVDLKKRLPELREHLDSLRQNATVHRLIMVDEALNLDSREWTAVLANSGSPTL